MSQQPKKNKKPPVKKLKEYSINLAVRQVFTNHFDIEAFSKQEAMEIAKKMIHGAQINRQWSKGYLQDNMEASPYWRADGEIEILSIETE